MNGMHYDEYSSSYDEYSSSIGISSHEKLVMMKK